MMNTTKDKQTGEGVAPREEYPEALCKSGQDAWHGLYAAASSSNGSWEAWMATLSSSEEDQLARETGFCVNGLFNMRKAAAFEHACNKARVQKLIQKA